MAFDQIIKGTLLPKVPLKTLWEEDNSIDSSTPALRKPPRNLPDAAQRIGSNYPFVKIGGQIVTDIETMIIDETGFLPTLSITFIDKLGDFAGDYFPKTNLILNLYLKASSEKFKPIRCDFLITSVKSMPKQHTGAPKSIVTETMYTIKGELYIPGLYTNTSKSYSNLTSKDALKKICVELGLGFAENESTPSDKMTWINTNKSNLEFMKEIAEHAYQDDDSFFMVFIDKYYYLNFIEVNKQLKVEDPQLTFASAGNSNITGLNQNLKNDSTVKQLTEETQVNYLTTELAYTNKPNFITTLNLISDQGSIIKNQGYKKQIYYYNHFKKADTPATKFTDFYMTPLKSIDRSPKQYLVPEELSLSENIIKKWMNIDYGNTHAEWNSARLLNSQNLKELDKIKLKATVNNVNFQVAKGFVVPLIVTVQKAEAIAKSIDADATRKAKMAFDDFKMNNQIPDRQLSGVYYVSGAKYYYDSLSPTGLSTEFYLARREWMPSKITEQNA